MEQGIQEQNELWGFLKDYIKEECEWQAHTHHHTVKYASSITLHVMTADYAKSVMIAKKNESI
jgi:hypothetical protein